MNLLFLISALVGDAWAFPEMVRHNYPNCATCHVSPNGGGIPNQYGRELSKEIMSTWGAEGEGNSMYGLVTPPSWLNVGGDLRSLYLYRNTPRSESGKWMLMQADLELAATFGQWTVLGTVGVQDEAVNVEKQTWITRRHYLMYSLNDEWTVRGGKFDTTFGIKIPEHEATIRRGLGWDQSTESYNVEASYIGELYNLYVTGVFGRPDDSKLDFEKGFALSAAYAAMDKVKVGASFYRASSNRSTRTLYGPHAIVGFMTQLSLLTQLSFMHTDPTGSGASTSGLVNYQKLSYEVLQGASVYVTQEYSRSDFSRDRTTSEAYGLGLQWMPRPHLEFNTSWQKVKVAAAFADFMDTYWLVMHFYL